MAKIKISEVPLSKVYRRKNGSTWMKVGLGQHIYVRNTQVGWVSTGQRQQSFDPNEDVVIVCDL
jgi:hypothetical protein